MRLLLFGCNGQVGWELQRSLAPLGELIALDFDSNDYPADFTRPQALIATVRAMAPDVIVNAAAYTAVDKAESEPDVARAVNAEAPAALAGAAAELGAWLVHYSTDYVFDGSGDTARSETALTGPLNVYGATKLEGEEAIRRSGCRHLILRTSWVYSARGGNFARTILKLAADRDALKVVDDQFGAPTGADLLADVTAHALHMTALEPALAGTYHVTASGHTSWHAYACCVIEQARARGIAVRVSADRIEPVASSAFTTAARRPLNSRLDCSRLQAAFRLRMPDWRSGVLRMLAEVHDC
jgi:dTDP-4-dehydrorhamnose reductase